MKIRLKKIPGLLLVLFLAAALLSSCGVASVSGRGSLSDTSSGSNAIASGKNAEKNRESVSDISSSGMSVNGISETGTSETGASEDAPVISGLTYESKMALKYASCFDVYYYQDGYKIIDVHNSARYLLVPEGKEAPEGLPDDIIVISQPLDSIYLAASSAMALFHAIGSLDSVKMTGTDSDGWYIDAPKKALAAGTMTYAGKYSEPDYEMLVDQGCDLAIESTMILHTPEVQEMIEDLGIPVFIDRSSYEPEALGRTEWIKLYGVLMNKEKEADDFFGKQEQAVNMLKSSGNKKSTVAFFAVNTDGSVVVRSANDYIPSMIEEGGGKYIFDSLNDTGKTGASVTMSMEEFYNDAVNADYLIYNATIEDPLGSIADLTAKNSLFGEFKAVKSGNVWQVGKEMYQATDIVSNFAADVNIMLTDGDTDKLTFLSRLK